MTWPTVALREVAKWGSGGTPPRGRKECFGPGVPWLSIADLNDGPVRAAKESLTEEGLRSSSAKVVPSGAILVAMYGSIGKLGVAEAEVCTSQAIAFAVPQQDVVDARYLFHFLLAARPRLVAMGRGGTQMNIGLRDLRALEMPLPSIEEQRRIAAILDKQSNLLAANAQAQAQAASLPHALYMSDPSIDAAPAAALVDLCARPDDIKCGPFGTQLKSDEFRSEGIPLWGIKQVNRAFGVQTEEFLHPDTAARLGSYDIVSGDIVMTRKGTVGNCAVYPESLPRGIMHSDLLRIRVQTDLVLPEFLSHQLHNSPSVAGQLARQSSGAVMPGLNVTKLKMLSVRVPEIDSQKEFVQRLRLVRLADGTIRDQRADLASLFESLQARAFSGRL